MNLSTMRAAQGRGISRARMNAVAFSRPRAFLGVVAVLSVFSLTSSIRAEGEPTQPESEAAHAELKEGFALRKQGRFAEALPHLAQSFRLAPGVKALLNMADCEEHLERLLDAERHWVQAREMAAGQMNDPVKQEAQARLRDLQARVPRLTVALAETAPATSRVNCDNVVLSGALLGVPLLYDPGRHDVEVRADGHGPRIVEVVLHEGDDVRVEVEPGPQLEASSASPTLESSAETRASGSQGAALGSWAASGPMADRSAPRTAATGADTLRYLGLSAAALGLTGVTVGVVAGLESQHHHALAVDACGSDCRASGTALREQATAINFSTVSTVGFVGGSVFAASAVVMAVLANRSAAPSKVRAATPLTRWKHGALTPLVGGTVQGVAFQGLW